MTIEERLSRLERSARRWRLAAGLAVLAAAGMGSLKPVPGMIEARNFVVRDDDGKVRAVLGLRDRFRLGDADVAESPMLLIYREAGTDDPPALDLSLMPDGLGGPHVVAHGVDKTATFNLGGVAVRDDTTMGVGMRLRMHEANRAHMPVNK